MRRFLRSIHWGDKLIDILVVVLGITIALWVNNWNQNRQNAQLEQQYLKNLKEDLVKDSLSLKEGNPFMKDILFSISRIEKLTDDKNNADSISDYVQAFGRDYLRFKPEDYTYDALRQTGDINIIQSDSLSKTLSQLYDIFDIYQFHVDVAWKYQVDLMLPYYYNRDFRAKEAYDNSIYLDPKFLTTILFYKSNLQSRQQYMREALDKIHILIGLIEQDLDE